MYGQSSFDSRNIILKLLSSHSASFMFDVHAVISTIPSQRGISGRWQEQVIMLVQLPCTEQPLVQKCAKVKLYWDSVFFLLKRANTPRDSVSCHTPTAGVRMTPLMPEFTLCIGDLVSVEKTHQRCGIQRSQPGLFRSVFHLSMSELVLNSWWHWCLSPGLKYSAQRYSWLHPTIETNYYWVALVPCEQAAPTGASHLGINSAWSWRYCLEFH